MGSRLTRSRGILARYEDFCLAGLLAVAAVYFFSGYFTPVRFDRERIEVQVIKGEVAVKGLYQYTNTSRLPAILTLKVPFPVDREHPPPEWFALYQSTEDGRALSEIWPVVRGADISFRLVFRPREAKWVRLDYAQQARVSTGRYLLTTTQAWRRPLARADFLLRLPRNFDLIASSYPVGSATFAGPWKAYSFSMTDFYPQNDWEFAWDESRTEAAMGRGEQP